MYGDKLEYHGKVVGFGAGTGGAFALLPAQNASGNWIKIVQRVPVRVAFEREELARHPLQVGLSMQVKVDTRDRDGERLPRIAQARHADASAVFGSIEQVADERVKSIIAGNDARAAVPSGAASTSGAATSHFAAIRIQ